MTTEEFYIAAIEGGYDEHRAFRATEMGHSSEFIEDAMFLDPEAWKAVAKIKGWNEKSAYYNEDKELYTSTSRHIMEMMIDHLWNGKTIEEYISTL